MIGRSFESIGVAFFVASFFASRLRQSIELFPKQTFSIYLRMRWLNTVQKNREKTEGSLNLRRGTSRMKMIRVTLALATLGISSPSFAEIELEVSGGSSSKNLEKEDGSDEKFDVKSMDVSLAVGYRFKKFLSIGLLASFKNYDMAESAKSLSQYSDSFYADSETFPSGPASIDSESPTGSSKGLVYGPQITLAYPGKYIQPYFRLAYQMGTLQTTHEYETTGTYSNIPIQYDIKIEEDRKSTFTQIGIGFRVPLGKNFYFLTDAAVEQMSYSSDAAKLTVAAEVDGESFVGNATNSESIDDKGGGTVFKLGLGASF